MAELTIGREFADWAVSGADHLDTRPGFAALLARAAANNVRIIVVETAPRFARDLIVQERGMRCSQRVGYQVIRLNMGWPYTPTGAGLERLRRWQENRLASDVVAGDGA